MYNPQNCPRTLRIWLGNAYPRLLWLKHSHGKKKVPPFDGIKLKGGRNVPTSLYDLKESNSMIGKKP